MKIKKRFETTNSLRKRNVAIEDAVQILDEADCVGGPPESEGRGVWFCFIRLGDVRSAMRGRK